MTPEEMRLRCLELAIPQAQREGTPGDRNKIAEIASWFYNHITGGPAPEPETVPVQGKRKPKADKEPEIFR